MTQENFFTLYFASLAVIGGLAGFVITHLLAEIKRLHSRVDEIYNILRRAGFAVDVSLYLISEKDAYPDWILPSIPDRVDRIPYEDDDED
jgi:hypothetical protein